MNLDWRSGPRGLGPASIRCTKFIRGACAATPSRSQRVRFCPTVGHVGSLSVNAGHHLHGASRTVIVPLHNPATSPCTMTRKPEGGRFLGASLAVVLVESARRSCTCQAVLLRSTLRFRPGCCSPVCTFMSTSKFAAAFALFVVEIDPLSGWAKHVHVQVVVIVPGKGELYLSAFPTFSF